MRDTFQKIIWLALIVAAGFLLSACKTTEDGIDNASSRPWNSPKGWESGFPSALTEGR